jgi:ribonuclease BN (tRNA processing enzyme)
MKLVVLGSGTSVPHHSRSSAAFWLETSSGTILLDCGAEAMHRIAQEHLDWPNLDAIWISHLHLDHCGGLASLLFGMKHAPQTQNRRKPLQIFTCAGVRKLLNAVDESNNYRLFQQPFPIKLQELPEIRDQRGEFTVLTRLMARTFSTPHTEESVAIRVADAEGRSLVYTADTGYSESLAEFAANVDLLILECSFPRDKPVQTHLDFEEALRLATLAKPRTLLLTHLYPSWDGIDLESEAGKLWPGKVVAAYDGLRLEVGND